MYKRQVHGGIADVYPLTMEVPVRIELWGDEIDTIRCFEPQSQRSMDQIECVSVFPAAEVIADDTDVYKRQLVTVAEGSEIPDGVTIGKNVAIAGKTAIEDYPDGNLVSGGYIIKGGEEE